MRTTAHIAPITSLLSACLVTAASLVSLSCSGGTGWVNPADWKEVDVHKLPSAADYPDAGAVILLDEGSMEMIGSGELGMSVFERHRIVKVLTVAGQRDANIVIAYGKG